MPKLIMSNMPHSIASLWSYMYSFLYQTCYSLRAHLAYFCIYVSSSVTFWFLLIWVRRSCCSALTWSHKAMLYWGKVSCAHLPTSPAFLKCKTPLAPRSGWMWLMLPKWGQPYGRMSRTRVASYVSRLLNRETCLAHCISWHRWISSVDARETWSMRSQQSICKSQRKWDDQVFDSRWYLLLKSHCSCRTLEGQLKHCCGFTGACKRSCEPIGVCCRASSHYQSRLLFLVQIVRNPYSNFQIYSTGRCWIFQGRRIHGSLSTRQR